MNQKLSRLNQKLAEEYRNLISLPTLSESQAERMAEILELANSDESLNCLIEQNEMMDYLKSKELNEDYEPSLKESQELQRLLRLISEDVNNFEKVIS
ncbi:MAG: hypothetical protein QNJ54_35890 [Prochloraceae cyanobacterium]|nr:hypothetical protein [Prochloraceae cyanobacterium]